MRTDNPTVEGAGKPAALRDPSSLTPAMRQYVEQKKRVGDAVLLFRMGDFYETFYEDAVLCSKVLGIALTSRSKAEDPIPLAGIPYHALDGYLSKLVRAGYKVAISEQIEDPKHAKGVVKRDVVRIVTAGTLTEDSLLDQHDDNLLVSVCFCLDSVGVSAVELASGRFQVISPDESDVVDELVRLRPAEVLIDDERDSRSYQIAEHLREVCGTTVTRRPVHLFSSYQAEKSLLDHFGVATLSGFGFEKMSASLCAAGGTIQYLEETQKSALDHITSVVCRESSEFVQLDQSSWRALEIDRTLRSGSREGTLLHAVDRSSHPIGSRKLRHWLCAPLRDADQIVLRQDAVSWLFESDGVRTRLRKKLKQMADVERVGARVALGRANPRDLRSLGATLASLPQLCGELVESRVAFLDSVVGDFAGLDDLADLLCRAIREDPAMAIREGGIIAEGFDEELDRLRTMGDTAQKWLAEYQQRETERTGISTLKVGFNRVFGYYIELSNANRDKAPADYVRKQTLKGAERYITDELKKFETEILSAQDKANEREYVLFEQVRQEAATRVEDLMRVADAIGRLDCVAGLADLAVHERYVRPEIVDDGRLDIRDGRHPVLDQLLAESFVPNDTLMARADSRVYLITGPNMAGKSTYIRQVALLTLLAQAGSFVPAASMVFSPVDRIFARVGASDELMRGQSTFMVEMTESANILHNATEHSLVVLDELGRGTSTFDGLSLAWAITEELANRVCCRTLMATHYHELTELADLLDGVRNYNVAVREHPGPGSCEDGIAFLHRIVEGRASKSYGVHVARLAGVPKSVVRRANEVLEELQKGFSRESKSAELTKVRSRPDAQMQLFADPGDELMELLDGVDPESITPIDALQMLKQWKDKF